MATKQDLLDAQAANLKKLSAINQSIIDLAARFPKPESIDDAVTQEKAFGDQLDTAKASIDAIAPVAPPPA